LDRAYAVFLNSDAPPTNPVSLRLWSDLCGPPKQFADAGGRTEDLKERPRYVWYAFYRYNNPTADPSDVTWFLAVCRVTGGEYFAQPDWATAPGSQLLSSQLPLPWLIQMVRATASNQLDSRSGVELVQGDGISFGDNTTLQVVRGAKLFSQTTGILYTVVRTLPVGSVRPTGVELRENVDPAEWSAGNVASFWVFPPPRGGSESPYVAGLVF
jgi:hypothetical protein